MATKDREISREKQYTSRLWSFTSPSNTPSRRDAVSIT
jgi:hypothetical protein